MKAYLVAKHGTDSSRLSSAGFGDKKPAAPNTSYPLTVIRILMTSPNRPGAPRPGAPKRDPQPNYSTVSSTGIEPNIAAMLSYVLGLITGIIFLVLEKDSRYVRFHAAQSIATSVIIILVSIGVSMVSSVLVFVPVLGWLVVLLLTLGLSIGTFILWVLLMVKAYQGQEWELPVAGGFARKMV